jgi:hypothetical protein
MTYAEEEWRARLAEHNREHGAWSPKLHVNGGATLPDLVVTTSNPAATAKGLAELFAERDDFLSNGHTPIRVVVNDDDMPHAIEVTPEAVRVYAHQLCKPVKVRQFKKDGAARIERIPVGLSRDLA